jgi:hypothetical protein
MKGDQHSSDILLDFRNQVRQTDIDRVLYTSKIYLKDGWSSQSASNRIVVDLSRVNFIDFAAAARILSVIEGCARVGRQVLVLSPSLDRRASEDRFLETHRADSRFTHFQQSVSTLVQRRRRAHGFLRNAGFFQALEMSHLNEIVAKPTLVTAERSASATDEADNDTPIITPSGAESTSSTRDDFPRPTILPFRWISKAEQAAGWEEEFVALLSTQLTKTDSQSLVHHVINELIDNVREHAGEDCARVAPWALVGAMVFNSRGKRYLPRSDMFYPAHDEYLRWLTEQTTPVVRLLVMDSGRGLTATIESEFVKHASQSARSTVSPVERNHAIALYAFSAGASRFGGATGRGIGLPAVRRFVRSYRGLIAIRAANISSGYACHHGSLEVLKNAALPYAPGTAVEIILGLSLGARARFDQKTADGIERVTLLWVESTASELEEVPNKADIAIRDSSARHPVILLSVYNWPRDRRVAFKRSILVSELANSLAGRAGFAVFLPELPAPEFESTFGAIDELRERGDRDTMDGFQIPLQTTPFMVVPSNGREYWSGGTRELRRLLYELSEGEELDDSAPRLQEGTLDYLHTEQDWLVRSGDGLRLRLQPGDIDRKIAEGVASDLARTLSLQPRGALVATSREPE